MPSAIARKTSIVAALAAISLSLTPVSLRQSAHADAHAVTVRSAMPDTVRTSMDGVFTVGQATRGSDVFATFCRSCHTPTFHTGPTFRAKWFGKPLSDLFGYLRREMPKSDPGSMSDEEYALALAYLLRMNGMPPGAQTLAHDSTTLHRIRLDSVRTTSTTQPHAQ